MIDHTSPVSTAFEFQRKSLEQGKRGFDQVVDFQHQVNSAVLDGVKAQQSVQHGAFSLQQGAVHAVLDLVETNVPDSEETVTDIRERLDAQYDFLADFNELAFDAIADGFDDSLDAQEKLTTDSLELVEAHVDYLINANEELEG